MNTMSPTAHEAAQSNKLNGRSPHTSTARISPFRVAGQRPSALFEREFRAELTALAPAESMPASPPRRSTISALMSALRTGVDVHQLLGIAQGLSASDLAGAYAYVETCRHDAVSALDDVIAVPTVERFRQVESRMRPLFPQLTDRLAGLADVHHPGFFAAVDEVARQIRVMEHTVHWIEDGMELDASDQTTSYRHLDDGHGGGVFHHQNYRPRRIGEIVPMRLMSLLGESDVEAGR